MSNKKSAIEGGKWITISTVVSTVFQFLQVTILARVLDPAVFGVVSVSTLIINLFYIFSNLGFSNSIIYKQESDRKVLSSLYFVGLILGFVIFLIVYFSSPLIVAYYKEPKLDRVIKLASLYFLIIYFGQIYLFLLQKELKFRSIAIMEIVGALTGTTVAITLAYNGFEELSLIYGQLAMHILRTALQIIYGMNLFKPQLYLSFSSIKEHLKFGIYNVGDGLLGFVQGNSDNIIVGGLLGVKALGFYTIAYQLAVFPITKLNPIILQVAYPILAKMKDDAEELKKSYLQILDMVSYFNIPLLVGLYITADSVVPLLYGSGWEETIPLIRIFVFVSIFFCLSHPLFTLAFTKGKPNLLFYINLATLIVKVPLLYLLGNKWQVTGIAFAFLISTIINLIINFYVVHYLIGNFFGSFLKNIAKPLSFGLLMVGAISLYKYFVGSEGVIHTVIEIIIGGGIYLLLTFKYKMSLKEILAYRKSA
ncbi:MULTISPECIES: MOP flippase family protein [unclassified Siphonobacter]|uniref:MOP flippase family protein n=1 Tax=unclassified Siphonobacter TaxID=2635712 RepID=UPI000CBE649E|nr:MULTISPECIES: MOP flippase family protein [unclassified Siphonobacter]MDQ1086911.1 lipopolysaccharide exporter [Siphonobacter sp. SORGH_AS_1065]MDR6193020.1 lipopolysaccharide exporter [Siphonobacter sp. SORGH_AS_0500]PKK35699.1 colanic acid exporter [Siphonobacter sp. SORGH_AS_0500]